MTKRSFLFGQAARVTFLVINNPVLYHAFHSEYKVQRVFLRKGWSFYRYVFRVMYREAELSYEL
ncbi:MAG: hypothetical protein ACI4UO_07060 [Paludibacteraceae bacterium]